MTSASDAENLLDGLSFYPKHSRAAQSDPYFPVGSTFSHSGLTAVTFMY